VSGIVKKIETDAVYTKGILVIGNRKAMPAMSTHPLASIKPENQSVLSISSASGNVHGYSLTLIMEGWKNFDFRSCFRTIVDSGSVCRFQRRKSNRQ